MRYYKNYKRILIRWLFGCLLALVAPGAFAQKYYTAQEGEVTAYYIYEDQLSKASGHKVEVIFNKDSKTLWVTIPSAALSTGNKRIDRKLFRKSKDEFVIKAKIGPENILYHDEEFFEFSLIGRVFNKVAGGPVSLSGKFDFKPGGPDKGFDLYMYFGVESKWMGAQFLKHSDYPVVNIRITAEVEPLDQDTTGIGVNN